MADGGQTGNHSRDNGLNGALKVLGAFARLGLTSFGGPIAHLGYFRTEFVERRRWLDEAAYADLVALCQFLPGPASSQVGFALGLRRAGFLGALAAWTGFTLPSIVLMLAFASGIAWFSGAAAQGALHGLKIVAVAVVAQAVWGMARSLVTDGIRAAVMLAAIALAMILPGAPGQLAAIGLGALAGLLFLHAPIASPHTAAAPRTRPAYRVAAMLIVLAVLLLALLPILRGAGIGGGALALFDAFYRAGALVFGGGHVVLPLLEQSVVASGWVTTDAFLSGYGAAQAVPGPLFSFAAYLGAISTNGPGGMAGAALATLAIFLPGLLLVAGALPFWDRLRTIAPARAAMGGVNAAVVGILAAALYDPVWTGAILSPVDFILALVAFLLLVLWKAPPLLVVALTTFAGMLLGLAS